MVEDSEDKEQKVPIDDHRHHLRCLPIWVYHLLMPPTQIGRHLKRPDFENLMFLPVPS